MKSLTDTIRLPNDIWAEISQAYSGEFILSWTDYLANSWEEKFPSLSCAFLRLSMLAKCCEGLEPKFFNIDENDMQSFSNKFFQECLS